MNTVRFALLPAALLAAVAASPACAQKVYTTQDYAQAERWMGYNVQPLVDHTVGDVTYLSDGRVFYKDPANGVTQYVIADPAKGTQAAAFDNAKLATALNNVNKESKQKYNPDKLNISEYKLEPGGFSFSTRLGRYHCDSAATMCHLEPPPPEPKQAATTAKHGRRGAVPLNMSPDGKLAVFVRDWNLWLRVMATGEEKQLTTDGVEDFGYATDNAGWQHSDAAIATWSADGKLLATFQQDQRKTGMMYMVPVTNRHPTLEAWRYPLVGDKDVTMIEPVVIDVASSKVTRLKTEPLQHRSMGCDDVSCEDSKWTDVAFSGDGKHLAFVSTGRDHKDEWMKVADTATGDVRDVFHEHVDTYYGWQSKPYWKYLPESNEFLWVSERSDYAQIYLYDLATGKLKNQVTHGDGPVWDILHVDEAHRVIYFSATDKEKDTNPYYRFVYSVGFDGSGQTLLTPEPMDHDVTMAPDGKSFVDVYSTPEIPATAVVRNASGKVLVQLAKQDISRLVATGWKPLMQIKVKARDGKTDLYGYLWRPTNFDATKKYPIVDYIYPGPQDGSCSTTGSHGFLPARGDMQPLAELGFITVCIDGMGNPHRSKSFHDAHASKPEEMGDDTIPDQVAGIKDLASQFSWIDVDRVGIWGHSGGGNATVSAMFHAPDFFKVGWSESGNHDNRDYEDDWDERWAGLEVIDKDGRSNYEAHANQNYAKNLKGKLMLVHGTMDDNVPSSNSLLVADALMKANKDFDMLMVPNAHHGYGEQTMYIMRRRWDYFVKNLAGGMPPKEYQMKSYAEIIRAMYGDGPSAGVQAGGEEQ